MKLLIVIILAYIPVMFILINMRAKKLIITKVSVEIGIRIAHISDLHFDKITVEPSFVIKEICKLIPEVILITGDLCSDLKYFRRVTAFLDMLAYKADCPILITLGNHDHKIFDIGGCTKEEYIRELESVSTHIHVLENEEFIYKDVLFGGIGDVKTNTSNYGALSKKWDELAVSHNYRYIIMTHNPDLALHLPKLNGLTLLLAGHTHGGQVRVPFNIEFAILKKDVLPKKKIYYGVHEFNGNKMYITSGIGCSFLPIRFRSKAEIAYLE